MSKELSKIEGQPTVAEMLSGALTNIQQGQITPQHVDVLGKMMDLYERNEKRQAEKDFASALTDLQAETIRVVATKAVPGSNGETRYKFAAYEGIMAVVQPMLTRHGFSITFDTETGDSRLTSICTLTHKDGHSRSNRFAVRYGKPPGSSDAQGDMSTKSYAKRGALCDALNISIEQDTDGSDARGLGAKITPGQADELERRAIATKSDIKKLLEFAEAESFADIDEGAYGRIDAYLRKKEDKAKPAQSPGAAPCDENGNLL